MPNLLQPLADLLLPPRCAACARPISMAGIPADERPFCETCWQSVLPLTSCCPVCAEPGPSHHCLECRRSPPEFSAVTAIFLYGGQLAIALLRFKYAGSSHLARPLGRLLAPAMQAACQARPDTLVVPVPLHPKRLRERGYNPSALLARQALGKTPACAALRRIRPTAAQAGLEREQRRRNLGKAFRAAPQLVRGRPILLVDDVLTTGATARACSEALLESGASSVAVLVLARAG